MEIKNLKRKADVGRILIEALLQDRETSRAPATGYSRSDFEFEKFSYSTSEHGAEKVIDDRTLKMYQDIFDAEQIHSQRAIDVVLRTFEIEAANAIYDASVWTGADLATALTNEWDDKGNCSPIEDVEAARLKVIRKSNLHLPNSPTHATLYSGNRQHQPSGAI